MTEELHASLCRIKYVLPVWTLKSFRANEKIVMCFLLFEGAKISLRFFDFG